MIRMRKFVSQLTALALTLPASFAAPATAHANQKPCDDVVVLEHQISKKTLHALQMPVKGSGDHMLAPSQVCKHLVLKRDNLMRHYQDLQALGAEGVKKATPSATATDVAKVGSVAQRNSLRQLVLETSRLKEKVDDGNAMLEHIGKVPEAAKATEGDADGEAARRRHVTETDLLLAQIKSNLSAYVRNGEFWVDRSKDLAHQIGLNARDLDALVAKGYLSEEDLTLFGVDAPVGGARPSPSSQQALLDKQAAAARQVAIDVDSQFDGGSPYAETDRDFAKLDGTQPKLSPIDMGEVHEDDIKEFGPAATPTAKPVVPRYDSFGSLCDDNPKCGTDPEYVVPSPPVAATPAPKPVVPLFDSFGSPCDDNPKCGTDPEYVVTTAAGPVAAAAPVVPPVAPVVPSTPNTPLRPGVPSVAASPPAAAPAAEGSSSWWQWALGGLVAGGGAVGGYFWWQNKKDEKKRKKEEEAAAAAAANSGPAPASTGTPEASATGGTANLCLKSAGTATGACGTIDDKFLPKDGDQVATVAFVCASSGTSCTAIPADSKLDVQPSQVLCTATKTNCGPPIL